MRNVSGASDERSERPRQPPVIARTIMLAIAATGVVGIELLAPNADTLRVFVLHPLRLTSGAGLLWLCFSQMRSLQAEKRPSLVSLVDVGLAWIGMSFPYPFW